MYKVRNIDERESHPADPAGVTGEPRDVGVLCRTGEIIDIVSRAAGTDEHLFNIRIVRFTTHNI